MKKKKKALNQIPHAGMRAVVFGRASYRISDAIYTEEIPAWQPATWSAYAVQWIGESGLPIEDVTEWREME